MFSGIYSLFSGKKHKHKHDDSTEEKSSDNDFVVLERRYSDESDKTSGLYPDLDPSRPPSNLPYAISPSLPNLKEATSELPKEEMKVDILQGVPFVLSPQLLLLEEGSDKSFQDIVRNIKCIRSDESLFELYNYDFELEHSVSSEFAES